MSLAREPAAPARLALAALAALAVLAPWPFGSVGRTAILVVTAVALGSAAVLLVLASWRGGLALPAVPLWPLGGLVALGLAQLVPLPPPVHAWVAPGSHAVWHPQSPAAAGVLGLAARPVSVDPETTLRGVALLAGLGLLAVAAAPALAHARAAARAAAALAAFGFALAAYAVWARAHFGALLYGTLSVPTVSPFGPFVNKNHFAGWTAMATLLTLGLAAGLAAEARARGRDWTAGGRRAAAVVLALVAALAMALAVVASLSRGGTAALLAGAACLAVLLSRSRRRARALLPGLALAAVLAAVVIALAPPAAPARLSTLSGAAFRLETWRDALRLAGSSPLFGHGLGAFHDAFPRVKLDNGAQRVEHAESEYLETLAETGLVGLALALCGFGLLLRGSGRAAIPALPRGIARGGVAALVALALHSAVDFDLRLPSNAALAALAAAAAAAGSGEREKPLGRAASAVLALGAMLLLGATLGLAAPQPSPPEDLRLVASASSAPVRQLRLARAEAALSSLLRRRPAHAESWLMLAGVRGARGDPAGAAALARRAVWLDPLRPGLREAAERFDAGPGDSP